MFDKNARFDIKFYENTLGLFDRIEAFLGAALDTDFSQKFSFEASVKRFK